MTSGRSRLAVTGTLIIAAVVLTGCGGGDTSEPSDATVATTEATTVTTGTTVATTEATVATTEATEATGEDQIDLGAILLRVDDLPEGWQELDTGSDEGGACLDALFGANHPLDPRFAEIATFGMSTNGPYLVAWVVGEPAGEVMVEIDDVVVACDGTTAPSGFTTTIDATPVPGLPDDSLSVHGADVNASGFRIDFTLAAAGSDRATVFVLAATTLGEIDDATIASAITAMIGRIPPA